MPVTVPAGRGVVTVLFTDIVGSTALAAGLGDRAWLELLEQHDQLALTVIEAHGGRRVSRSGDGLLATFQAPTVAIDCAAELLEAVHDLGLELRAGLHTGEVEHRGDGNVAGIGVHVAARIAALADLDEILVSTTVRELMAGSQVTFTSRGLHTLKGVPRKREVFSVGVPGPERSGVTVMLVDDHPLWRETLAGLLDGQLSTVLVGEAGNGEDAVTLAADLKPDVILMDIDMPRKDGIAATAEIVRDRPEAKVVMLSSLKDRNEVLAAVRAGASGYLLKTSGASEIAEAITRVSAGEMAFPGELTSVIMAELRGQRPAGDIAVLSEQEMKVLAGLAAGLSNAAIAKDLHLSAKDLEGNNVFITNYMAVVLVHGWWGRLA